jgi:hypothetical protein
VNKSENFKLPWFIEILLKSYEIRFQYHFYGKKETNRIDKPQFFFIFIQNCLESSVPFLMKNLKFKLDIDIFVQGLLQLGTEKMIRVINNFTQKKS